MLILLYFLALGGSPEMALGCVSNPEAPPFAWEWNLSPDDCLGLSE